MVLVMAKTRGATTLASPPKPAVIRATKQVELFLPYKPRKWQVRCHAQHHRFKVLALHRRAGKTEFALQELVDCAISTKRDKTLFVYMAPLLKQAKLIAWDRLKQIVRAIPGAKINESELYAELGAARIQVFGGDNPDGMRGVRLDGAVIDEVAQIKPEVWNEIVQPALSDRKGWALFIGTPKGINLFSDLFHRANTLPDWFSAAYTVYDTDALDPVEVERLKRDMPENEFRREYLCDFSAAADNQLMSVAQVEEAAQRHLSLDDYDHAPLVFGVDPARFGDDRSVLIMRRGLLCMEPMVWKGIDNMLLASYVAQEVDRWKPDAVFIDVGNGSGVIDRLRQLGHAIIEINFGGKPQSTRYVNKRTEMWWLMKQWVEMGGAIPNRMELKQDMATPTFSYNDRNQIDLETKDEIKKRILRSPDEADALALTFAFPVAPREHPIHPAFAHSTRSAKRDYDPLENI